jgi:hypothetical protein
VSGTRGGLGALAKGCEESELPRGESCREVVATRMVSSRHHDFFCDQDPGFWNQGDSSVNASDIYLTGLRIPNACEGLY